MKEVLVSLLTRQLKNISKQKVKRMIQQVLKHIYKLLDCQPGDIMVYIPDTDIEGQELSLPK